ncbi:MAG TPA: ribosome maturation factor RimM [Halothiobacillus sp.]|nr:ribosome maturation factor RimM [Halothiobacillus sp.]HQS28385.1 ribosome maturation factor RimM [Halothiobacillus sp.]
MKTPPNPAESVVVGTFGRAFGIKGWCWITAYTRPIEGITQYREWFVAPPVDEGKTPVSLRGDWVKVSAFASQSNGLVAKLAGVDNRTQAEALTGSQIWVSAQAIPKAAEGEYYWRDLIGCQVIHLSGQVFGTVHELIETGANDVLVVQSTEGEKRERLIPFIPDAVLISIDLTQRVITVDWDPEF